MLYDKEPSKISKELTERDNIGNDDFFVLFSMVIMTNNRV
jgi:hypothetical protein